MFTGSFSYAQTNDVNSIRLWHSPNKTTIVFDVSSNIDYNVFFLKEPERLVVDIKNSNQKSQLPALESNNDHISAIRFGAPKKDVLRFVFHLKRPLQQHSFLLTPNELYGHRLVLDLLDVPSSENQISKGQAPIADTPDSLLVIDGNSAPINQAQSTAIEESSAPIIVSAPELVSVPRPRKFVVAIDAGHGGEDPGAIGNRGSREKVITLSIAQRLKKVIDADPRMEATLIRTGDYYIDLQRRRLMAREKQADIFVSIHADAFTKSSANGLSVFALSQRGATSAMARALAAKENASDLIGGVSLANKDVVLAKVLVDLSMTNTISESVNLGGRVLKELDKVGRLHSKRVEQANFAVLRSPDVPSILIETGFITNLDEERKLRSASYQKKIANSVYKALGDYYDQTPYYSQASYASPVIASGSSSNLKNSRIAYHKVRRGDSLSKIAQRYGMSLRQLKELNGLKRNTAILGQRLKVNKNVTIKQTQVATSNTATKKVSHHRVKSGESLSIISAKYNVTISALRKLNNLKTSTLRVGQRLKLPAGTKTKVAVTNRKHVVKRGDTLSEIAEQYGVTIKKLMKANKMKSRTVFLNQRLSIPN